MKKKNGKKYTHHGRQLEGEAWGYPKFPQKTGGEAMGNSLSEG